MEVPEMEIREIDTAKVAEKLKRLREERQMQQQDVAALVGVSPSMVSLWESGKRLPSIAVLSGLAEYYNTSLDALVGIESPSVKQFERWRKLTKDLRPEQLEALDYIVSSMKPVPKEAHTEDCQVYLNSGNGNKEDTTVTVNKNTSREVDWKRSIAEYYRDQFKR